MTLLMDPVIMLGSLAAAVPALLALVLCLREERTLPTNLMVAGLLVLAAEQVAVTAGTVVLLPEQVAQWQRIRLLFAALAPGPWLVFSLVYARSNFREFIRSWRVPLVLAAVGPLVLALAGWGGLVGSALPEEGRVYWPVALGPAGRALLVALVLFTVLVLMNLERTLRASRGTQRWRIKLLVAGLLVMLGARLYGHGQALFTQALDPLIEVIPALALVLGCALIGLSLRRAPGLHVDLYVSNQVVFGSLTLLLAAVYLAGLGVFARLLARESGGTGVLLGGTAVVAGLAFLLLLLLSDRFRVALRRALTRHLRRPAFDYREVWRAFTARTMRALNEDDLARAVADLASETFETLTVSFWLLDDRGGLRLASSTGLAQPADVTAEPVPEEVIACWRSLQHPVDLDHTREPWAERVRQWNPGQFHTGGHRFCAVVQAESHVLGLMTMGDRVRGLPFTAEELDLFQLLADHSAARLLALRLANRLLAAKQMEAFQMMSAFLIHDLKNTTSSLSLTLSNLKQHMDEPAFRKDAERTMSAGVRKMNDVVARLGALRRGFEIQPAEVEVAAWVADALRQLDAETAARVAWTPGESLRWRMDPQQMQCVLLNLVLNARDASPPGAPVELRATTERDEGVLSVRDHGCGMTREFLATRLFRPFQTTKKNGMGVGLFQSRTIVEAHGGRMEVESEPGRGTVFRVRIPVRGATT